ncbi:RNA-binding protein [candidate division TA06 bacterium]|uniref:RNA-binding protein n=1 Tax=candidate division TA06 bacterium TaxID=2250710 RepID=A0A660S534_UNCT6|nr:MAG: RNA-binding protein [candidate division TA06 bacterium]
MYTLEYMTNKRKGERVDILLKKLQIVKSREKAKHACENGRVFVNDTRVKASRIVNSGDTIRLTLNQKEVLYEIIDIPELKNIKKSDVMKYYKIVGENE